MTFTLCAHDNQWRASLKHMTIRRIRHIGIIAVVDHLALRVLSRAVPRWPRLQQEICRSQCHMPPVQRKQLELSSITYGSTRGSHKWTGHVKVLDESAGPWQALPRPAACPEQKVFYEGTAMEYAEHHMFLQHNKAWGGADTGPGIRFVCEAPRRMRWTTPTTRASRQRLRCGIAGATRPTRTTARRSCSISTSRPRQRPRSRW